MKIAAIVLLLTLTGCATAPVGEPSPAYYPPVSIYIPPHHPQPYDWRPHPGPHRPTGR